jgi:hypothetical protein
MRKLLMRIYEIIIIYLAVGAPFGVSCFQQNRATGNLPSSLATAFAVWLGWPLSIFGFFILPRSENFSPRTAKERLREQEIERAGRALTVALYNVEDALAEEATTNEWRKLMFAARRSVERYVGLALVVTCEESESNAPPTRRETETPRIAARQGKDLIIAGRCIRRRMRARLLSHSDRARVEFFNALAALHDLTDCELPTHDFSASRTLSEKIIFVYERAIELLNLLDEPETAMSIAQLSDAESTRLGQLEISSKSMEPEFEAIF